MPATLPTPTRDTITNYPPALADALIALFNQGHCMLTLPVAFGTADAAVLFTVPTLPSGARLSLQRGFWEVTTGFSGGSSSAIGCSSSNAAYNTKGDLLGGAGGDVAAGLTAGFKGTIGAKAATQGVIVLIAGDTIRFDRIVSAFTAGAGFAHFPCTLLPTS